MFEESSQTTTGSLFLKQALDASDKLGWTASCVDTQSSSLGESTIEPRSVLVLSTHHNRVSLHACLGWSWMLIRLTRRRLIGGA